MLQYGMSSIGFLVVLVLGSLAVMESASVEQEKNVSKRSSSIYPDEYLASGFGPPLVRMPSFPVGNPWLPHPRAVAPSPAEVSNIIASAKQASANVLIAQQQVQAAKENVLNQQRVAMEKETNAAILTQKSETAAAVQRSEAAAAAQAVILAQQRLAAAKAAAAHQQRIAAAKEADAASALQSAAQAAAAEIHRTEVEATKFANLQRNGAANIAHHVTATKDAIVSPLSSGTNHIPNAALHYLAPPPLFAPWSNTGPAGAGPLIFPSKAAFAAGHIWG